MLHQGSSRKYKKYARHFIAQWNILFYYPSYTHIMFWTKILPLDLKASGKEKITMFCKQNMHFMNICSIFCVLL